MSIIQTKAATEYTFHQLHFSYLIGGFNQGDVYEPIICRTPNYCNETLTSWPSPPIDHGLQAKPTPSVGVPEFSYLTFNCSDSNQVMYKPPLYIEKFPEDYEFKVNNIFIIF